MGIERERVRLARDEEVGAGVGLFALLSSDGGLWKIEGWCKSGGV